MRAQRGFFVRGQPGTPQNEPIASTSLGTTDSPPAGVPPHSAEKRKIANLLSQRADWARNRLRSCRSRFFPIPQQTKLCPHLYCEETRARGHRRWASVVAHNGRANDRVQKNGRDPHFTAQQRHRPLCRRTKAERACRICPRTAPADSPQEPQATAEHPQLSVLSRPGTSR